MGERDPRVDPVKGDILESADGEIRRTVDGFEPAGRLVVTQERYGEWFGTKTPWLSQWQRWAANATVIRRAEEVIDAGK